jgi:hypothetical protein
MQTKPEPFRLTSDQGLYVVEQVRTGEWLYWSADGPEAYDVMTVANLVRAGVEG